MNRHYKHVRFIYVSFVVPRNVEVPTIDNYGKSYIRLKWTKPNATRSHVGVSYGLSSSLATITVNTDAHTQIDGLRANTAYTVNLYTRSGDLESTNNTIYINTSEFYNFIEYSLQLRSSKQFCLCITLER